MNIKSMKMKIVGLIAVSLLTVVSLRASTPATFVNFNAANATINPGPYKILPITYSDAMTGRWNFDPTLTTPLVPATATTAEIFGGINVVSAGTLGSTPFARLHNNVPPAWPNAPKVYVESSANSGGVNYNNVNLLYLWKRSDFPGNQPSYSDTFNSSSTLLVNITDDAHVTGGNAEETRFIILNGSTYYISEAKATNTGTFTLTNFTNNSTAGFRWAPIILTDTSFDIPQSGLVYSAQNFGDVQAVGWIGRGSRNYTTLFAFDAFSATGLYSSPVMKMSMNLAGVAYYSTSHPFLDVFKITSTWLTANSNTVHSGPWNTALNGYGLALDSNGWPTKLPFTQTLIPGPYTGTQPDPRPQYPTNSISSQQFVHTLLTVYETGHYRLRFRGTGSFSVRAINADGTHPFDTSFGPTVAGSDNTAGIALTSLPLDTDGVTRYWDSPTITVDPASPNGTSVYFNIYGSDPNSTGDYLRNIEFLSPSAFTVGIAGDTVNRITSPFNPDFYANLHNYATLRMMDWGATNGSAIVNWTDRTLPSTYTQSMDNGVALEYQIAIANLLNENMWVNVPHQATQDYVQKLALVLHNGSKADGTPYMPGTDSPSSLIWPGLNSNLKVYIEYSNETWNSQFPQYSYCQTHGQALGFPSGKYGDYYAAYQSANIWQWFYNQWGSDGPKRLVRVMGSQFSTGNATYRLSAFTAGILAPAAQTQYPDALAVAPYFGSAVANSLVPTYVSVDGSINTATTPQIIGDAKADVEGNILTTINALKTLTNTYGVNLNCYEGGQGLVATYANVNNNTLTSDLLAANRDPSMGTLYTEYLGELQNAGVVEFCNYNYINAWGKYGSWGVIEYLNQTTHPKFDALVAYQTSFPNANSNIPPTLDLMSTVSGTTVSVPEAVVDTAGAGSVVVPLSSAQSVDYDGTIVATQWIVNGVIQSTTANTISPTLPVGNNTIVVTVTDNSGASTSETVQILVRPKGSDTVIVQSDFTGAGSSVPTPQTAPWTPTSILASGLGYSGWTFLKSNSGVYGRIGNSSYPNAYRASLMNGYPLSGTPNNSTPLLLADAVSFNLYLTVTVTPPSGHSLDLRGAAIQWTLNPLGNSQSARETALFVGVGGLPAQPAVSSEVYDSIAQYPTGMKSPTTFTYYVPVTSAYSNITQPTEIRIYLYNNMYGQKELQLNGFQMTGVVH